MKNIALILRHMQFIAHAGHNLTSGPTFFQDHETLGELYPEYEAAYDSVIERIIGLGNECDPLSLTMEAAEQADAHDIKASSPKEVYSHLLEMERSLLGAIDDVLSDGVSHGTSNLLEGLADQSEIRVYKLRRCTK